MSHVVGHIRTLSPQRWPCPVLDTSSLCLHRGGGHVPCWTYRDLVATEMAVSRVGHIRTMSSQRWPCLTLLDTSRPCLHRGGGHVSRCWTHQDLVAIEVVAMPHVGHIETLSSQRWPCLTLLDTSGPCRHRDGRVPCWTHRDLVVTEMVMSRCWTYRDLVVTEMAMSRVGHIETLSSQRWPCPVLDTSGPCRHRGVHGLC